MLNHNFGFMPTHDFGLPHYEPHHNVEVDVFACLVSRKERQVLRLHLVWVIQYGPRIETSLQYGDIIPDPCWDQK